MKAARFPSYKTLENFDFRTQPSVNKILVSELMRCLYIENRENILLVGVNAVLKLRQDGRFENEVFFRWVFFPLFV